MAHEGLLICRSQWCGLFYGQGHQRSRFDLEMTFREILLVEICWVEHRGLLISRLWWCGPFWGRGHERSPKGHDLTLKSPWENYRSQSLANWDMGFYWHTERDGAVRFNVKVTEWSRRDLKMTLREISLEELCRVAHRVLLNDNHNGAIRFNVKVTKGHRKVTTWP